MTCALMQRRMVSLSNPLCRLCSSSCVLTAAVGGRVRQDGMQSSGGILLCVAIKGAATKAGVAGRHGQWSGSTSSGQSCTPACLPCLHALRAWFWPVLRWLLIFHDSKSVHPDAGEAGHSCGAAEKPNSVDGALQYSTVNDKYQGGQCWVCTCQHHVVHGGMTLTQCKDACWMPWWCHALPHAHRHSPGCRMGSSHIGHLGALSTAEALSPPPGFTDKPATAQVGCGQTHLKLAGLTGRDASAAAACRLARPAGWPVSSQHGA